MLVLGIDPGYAIVGWGVLRYDRNQYTPVDFGAITTDAGTDFSQRLSDVYDGVYRLCQRYHPGGGRKAVFYQQSKDGYRRGRGQRGHPIGSPPK